MKPEFSEANDAAADSLVALLSGGELPPDPTPDEGVVAGAPASGAAETTSTDDDGETLLAPEVEDEGKPVVAATTPDSKPSPDGFDPQKTLSKYKTQEEKDAALVEKDRELLKRSKQNEERDAEIARLKSENESLRGGKPTPEAPTTEEHEEPADFGEAHQAFLGRINAGRSKPEMLATDEERRIAAAVTELEAENKQVIGLRAKVNELQTEENSLLADAAKLATIIKAQEEDLAAEPDDFALQNRLEANRKKAESLDFKILRKGNERIDARERFRDANEALNDRIVKVDTYAKQVHLGFRNQKQATATEAAESKELNGQWQTSAKTLFEVDLAKHDLSTIEQKFVLQDLANRLSDQVRTTGVPADFLVWQRENSKEAVADVLKSRTEAQQRLLTKKTADLPKKPKNNEVPRSAPGGKTSSFNQTLREAGDAFDRALGL